MRTVLLHFVLLLVAGTALPASRHHSGHHNAPANAGQFDFYVFVLSWSPEFCYSHPTAGQCAKHISFVVHGLWPQNDDGTYPQHCQTSQPPPSNFSSMSDIMPAEIVEHEWIQHGTCSGLSGNDYFALIRKLYESIHIPQRYQRPSSSFTVSASDLKRAFEQANQGLNDANMAVQLRGNYLNAVEFCRMKDSNGEPAACSGIKDTLQGTFVVPPVK